MGIFRKNIILLMFFSLIITQNSYSQNSYGWERIFNSIYGMNGFYLSRARTDNHKIWMVRSIGDFLGSGNYDFIKYNHNSDSWYPASNSIFKGIYYSYYIGYIIEGYAFPKIFEISPSDSDFILINTIVPHMENPPYDIRLFYSYDNGNTKQDVQYFQIRGFSGLAIDPVNDSINYASSGDSVFKSTDRGISWTPVSTISSFNSGLKINPFNPNYIFAIADSLFISTNGGTNFNFVSNRRYSDFIFKNSDSSILASSKNKFYRSFDFGYTWSITDSLSDSITFFDNDPDNENIIYAGSRKGLYKSTDYGGSFNLFNNSFSPSKIITGICKQANTNFVYVATEEAVYKCWSSYIVDVNELSGNIPNTFHLQQNFPNPFNPKTIINYQISMINFVTLKVFDILGNEVATLVNQKQNAGSYEVEFDGSNLSSGIYFYRMEVDGNIIESKRMILLK